jgi:hypothetical protein
LAAVLRWVELQFWAAPCEPAGDHAGRDQSGD